MPRIDQERSPPDGGLSFLTAIIRRMKKPVNGSDESLSAEERHATFDRQQKVMAMFSDDAKTYIQLSSAALALTLTFAHDILNIPKGQPVPLTTG